MDHKHSGPNVKGEGRHNEVHLLQSSSASSAWIKNGGKDAKKHHRIVTDNEMQFGFISDKGRMLILRRLKKEHNAKKISCICVLKTWRVFHKVPKKVLE